MKCCSITAYKQAQKYKTETQKYKTCYKSTVRVITLTLTVHVKHLYGDTCQSMAGILAPPYIILSICSYFTNHLGYSVQMKHASRYGQVLGVDMKILPPPWSLWGAGCPICIFGHSLLSREPFQLRHSNVSRRVVWSCQHQLSFLYYRLTSIAVQTMHRQCLKCKNP